MSPEVSAWLARAVADAESRGLPELKPLLETLSRSLQALRDADREFRHPAATRAGEDVDENADDDPAS